MPPLYRIPHFMEKVQRILEKVLLSVKLVEKVSFAKNLVKDAGKARYCSWMFASMTC